MDEQISFSDDDGDYKRTSGMSLPVIRSERKKVESKFNISELLFTGLSRVKEEDEDCSSVISRFRKSPNKNLSNTSVNIREFEFLSFLLPSPSLPFFF